MSLNKTLVKKLHGKEVCLTFHILKRIQLTKESDKVVVKGLLYSWGNEQEFLDGFSPRDTRNPIFNPEKLQAILSGDFTGDFLENLEEIIIDPDLIDSKELFEGA